MKLKYCIDIDGVIGINKIVKDFSYKNLINLPVNEKVIERINLVYDAGHEVTLYTARLKRAKKFTWLWLKKNNVKFHKLRTGKPDCDFYIDDRMLSLDDFLK